MKTYIVKNSEKTFLPMHHALSEEDTDRVLKFFKS